MSRSTFTDFFRQFVPKNVKSTEGILCEKKEPEFTFTDFTNKKKTKKRGESKGNRDWSQITTIMLHQTAVVFSSAERMLNVPSHSGVLSDGEIVLLHTPTDYMWHGNSANKFSIGIEISCRAAGVEGNPDTFWMRSSEREKGIPFEKLVHEASDIQLAASRELCRYYIELVEKNGGKIEYMMPHRSAHKSRVSDPGSRIWQNVALPIMEEFGLKLHKVVGSGNPVPEAWDPDQKGVPYNWKVKGF